MREGDYTRTARAPARTQVTRPEYPVGRNRLAGRRQRADTNRTSERTHNGSPTRARAQHHTARTQAITDNMGRHRRAASSNVSQACKEIAVVTKISHLANCTLNVTFGCYTRTAMWVSGGCRAFFAITGCESGYCGRVILGCGSPHNKVIKCSAGKVWAPVAGDANESSPAEWRMSHGCIGYVRHAEERGNRMLLAQAIQDDGSPANWSISPRTLPGYYLEDGHPTLNLADPPSAADVHRMRSWPRRWHSRPGVVLDLSEDNLFHVIFSVVPTMKSLAQRLAGAGALGASDLLPRYTQRWPDAHNTSHHTTTMAFDPSSWPAWEVYTRAILGNGGGAAENATWADALRRTTQIVNGSEDVLHCFPTLTGGHPRWWPSGGPFRNFTSHEFAFRAARPSIAALRAAVMATVRAASSPPSAPAIVFEVRERTRAIVNQAAVVAAVRGNLSVGERVHFTSLSALPVARQLEVVNAAAGLAGMHGAGLANVIFLPSDVRRCAVLEIKGWFQGRQESILTRFDYPKLAVMSDVRMFSLFSQQDAPECVGKHFRSCGNVTVDASALVHKLGEMLAHVDG